MKPDSKYMTLEDLRKKQQSDPRYMSAADLNARLEDKKRKEEERVRKEQERVRKEQEKLEIQEKQKPVARYEDPKDPISNYQKSLNAIDEINKSLGISTSKKTMPFKRDEKIHSDLDTTPEERKLEFKPEEKSTKTYSEPEEYTEPKPFSKATAVAAKIGAEYMVGFEKGINTLVDFGFGIMANAARTFGKDDKAELYDMARAYVYESKYKQASRELDDFLSPKAREGHLLQKASQFTGELAGLVTFSFLGDKATKGLFKVFSGGSTGAAISTLTENAATGTAQQVANKTGKIVTRVGGAAARYLYTRGSSMSELLEKGYTYDEAAKVANIYSGISAGLDLTTNVVYGAFSTTLLKDFTDKTVVNGTEIIIQELTKKEMIISELLRTLKVGNVEALKGVARSATKNELERMILDPTKLGYFKNENGEISLTRAGQDYLVNFVISSIVQTPGRIKNIEAFDKYQSQLMTDTAKQVDLSKASRIEISKSVKKGDSVKASPIVRTPENEQFLNSILDAAKKDGIDLTEGMNIGDGVDIVYDPDLRYEIVRTDGTKIEVHGGFKYVFEKDYHVNIQQEKNDVPKISVKKKSTDVGADYIKITNDIVSSDNPVDVKVNLLEHQISGLNNVLVSNIKITPKLMKDVYTNKQTLIKAKEELLSKASDTELNIIYAGSKAAEYSAKTAPDSDNKAQIIDEIQKEKENVATLLDKDRDIKLITNKATVEKEFTENTTGAIDILNKLNENRPENDKIKFVQDYTEDQQLAVDVGSAFGKQVFFIENSNFSGFTVDTNPNVLFIDSKPVNALIKDQNSAFTYVVGHELFHSLKEVDPVTYNSFMRYIYTEVNAEQVLNFIDKYDPTATLNTINALKINGKLNMDELIKNPHEYLPQTAKLLEIVEEMAANEFGGILTTPDFWIGMNNRDSKVAERLSDIAGRMIDKINEPVYDSPLTQVQVDRIKNKFLDIISGIEEKEIEKVAKPKLPVKKEVEIKEKYQKNYWKDIGGEPANSMTFSNEHGRIVIMERQDNNSNNIFETYVDPEYRNQGLGTKLLQTALDKYPNLQGQFSSEASVKNAYKLGFRTLDNASLENTLKIQKEMSSVIMIHKDTQSEKTSTSKLPVKKVESKKVTPKKEVVSEPVTKTVSKIAEKATGKKINVTTKNNTIIKLSKQSEKKRPNSPMSKYYEGENDISFTDSYSLYSLNKNTEMPISKGSAKEHKEFYEGSLKKVRETMSKDKENETTTLDIETIKENKKNKSNIDYYSGTKSGVTFIDDITVDTDYLINAIKILGTNLKYSTANDGIPRLFVKNQNDESVIIMGIKKYDEDPKPKLPSKKVVETKKEVEKKTSKVSDSHKKEQLDIILKENPAPKDIPNKVWIRTLSDVKTAEEVFTKKEFEEGTPYPDFSLEDAKKALEKGKINVYSSHPIKNGTFVSTSKMEATEYAGGKEPHSKIVKLDEIAWIHSSEGQYANVKETKPALPAKELPDTSLQERLSLIKDNFELYKDTGDHDILNTVIKDYKQYKKEGGTGKISDLDSYMATKDKTIADWKDRLKASGVNIKELPKKQTKLYQSLQNSPNEKIATDIIKLYNEGKIIIEHKTQSNPETYEKAMQKLLVDQEGAIHNFFHETNEITPEAVAMGDILLQYYSHTGDLDEMANVWTRLHPLGTTTGRTLQMFSNLQKTTPEGYIHIVYKELDKINEILKSSNDPIIRAWIRENAGGIILEDYEQDVLYTMTKAMFGLNQDDSKRNILESQIMKIINNKIPKGWVEKGLTLHRDAMLGNMRTPGRNWMGNVPTLPFNILSQKHVGVKLDKYLSKKTGIRTMGELKNKRKHYLEGIKQAVTDFKLEINTNPTNAFERQSGKAFDDDAHFGKLMNNIDRLVSFNMDVGDRGFFNVYYRGELDAFRELNGGKPPTDLQKQIATERAEKLTWKNHGRLYEFTRSARNLLNYVHFSDGKINVGFDDMNKGTPVFGIGNVVLPFIMTPANLTVSLYDFSPLSFGSVMLAKHKFDKAIESGNHEQIFRAQRNLNERLGYAISGTVMWLLGGLLIAASKKSKKFKVTADYDSKVKQLQRDIGWQPYAFQIEDSFYTYSWSEPAGTALGVLAEIDRKKAEKLAKGEKLDLFESFRSMLSTMGDSMLEQSYLIALSDLFGRSKYSRMDDGEMEGFARNLRDTAGNAVMQFVPSFVRSLSNYLDSTYKETYEKDAFGKSLSGRILGNIPGLKGTLPSKKNLFGDTAIIGGVKQNPVTRFFNTMLNPAKVSKSNYYPEYTELMRIYQTTGTTDFMPREVTNEIVYKDKTITLTAKQKTEIQEQMGKIYHKALTGLMRNSIYSDATSFEKAKLLNGLSLYSRDKAIEEVGLFENYELKKGTMAEKIQRYQDSGLSIESALLYHGIINSLDTNSQKAKSIMDMTVSQKEKDIMLRLVSPTAKTSPTSSDLGHLDTDVDFDAYYSLLPAKREQHSKYGKYFNIKIDTFASAIKDISKIESKKDTAGKTIPNSKRDQVRAYIEKLPNLSAAQKLYLYNTVGYTINTKANSEIMHKYIESLSLSAKDKLEIWKALGFK